MNQFIDRLFNVLLIVVIVLFAAGCDVKQTEIIIFHTNDSHGSLDNFPRIAALVEKEIEINPNVFLVSAGDIFSGNPMVDHYDPPGYPKIDLMNRVGYDLNVIGNHEFDYGLEVLKDRMEQANFPFVLANADFSGTILPQPAPYVLKKAGKSTIAFIGIVQLNSQGIPSTHPDRIRGVKFENPVEKLSQYSFLDEKADVVIAVTHHGFLQDTLMAYNYPWLDLIIGGHSHTLTMEPSEYNNVLITHAGSNLEYIGRVTLIFKGKRLINKRAEVIQLENLNAKDEELEALVAHYNNNPTLNRVIGVLKRPIDGKKYLACLTSDAYRKYAGLDFAFQNFGGIRVDKLEGEIRVKDIYKMDPFGNELIQQELSYNELRGLIGNNLSQAGLPSLQISGGVFEIHLTKDEEVESVRIFDEKGVELKNDRKYKVGMPSYVASAFTYDQEDSGISLGITTAMVLIHYISSFKEVEFEVEERIIVTRD